MDHRAPEVLIVAAQPSARIPGACPHCQATSTFGVHSLTNRIFRSNEGSVLICDACGGYAQPFTSAARIARSIRFVTLLLFSLAIPVGFPLLLASKGGLSFSRSDLPPIGLLVPVLAILGLSLVGAVWSVKGLRHSWHTGPLVALDRRFQAQM